MYFCTVNGNSSVMIYTLSSAHWQQALKLSALRHFESIWKDLNKSAYQYNNNNKNNSAIDQKGDGLTVISVRLWPFFIFFYRV